MTASKQLSAVGKMLSVFQAQKSNVEADLEIYLVKGKQLLNQLNSLKRMSASSDSMKVRVNNYTHIHSDYLVLSTIRLSWIVVCRTVVKRSVIVLNEELYTLVTRW